MASPAESPAEQRRGAVLVLLSTAAYAAMPILTKIAYAEGVRPSGVLAYRFAIAVALFAATAPRGAPPLEPRQRAVLWGLGVVFLVNAVAYFKALETAPASLVALVVYTYPVVVALLSGLAGFERLTARGLVAAALAVLGCALTLGGVPDGAHTGGIALAFVAAVVYAAYIVLGSRVGARLSAEATARHVAQASAVAFTAWAAIDGGLALPPSMAAWGSLVVIAVVSTVVALRALLAGLARIGPGRTAVLSALEVPLTLGLAAAFLGEGLGARQWAGGGLILGAVLLQNIAMPGVLVRRRAGPLGSGGRGGGREGN